MNVIEQYYRGITQQIRAEVNFINSLFQHQGVKGEGNEILLRNLITKFIPKKYGVGTGIVIDRLGNQSRQSDIIIYDTLQYPSLLSLSGVHLFPVDIVYATVEVKTTLDSQSVKESLRNIASLKALKIIEDVYTVLESKDGSIKPVNYKPGPPLGFVFGYKSDAQFFETFKTWFTPPTKNEIASFPILVGCLDQGLVLYKDLYPNEETLPEGWLIPLLSMSDGISAKPLTLAEDLENYTYESVVYPVKRFRGERIVIDHSRILLLFALCLTEMLSYKTINPKISFINTYLPESSRFYYKM